MSIAKSVFSPYLKTNGVGLYPLTNAQMTTFFDDIWQTNFVEGFLQKVLGNPIDAILSIRYFYGLKYQMSSSLCNVTVGNVSFNGVTTDHAVQTYPLLSEYSETDKIKFSFADRTDVNNPLFQYNLNNTTGTHFMDYAPYTTIDMFLPFVGFISFDPADLYGLDLYLYYRIHIPTGNAVAIIARKYGVGEEMLPIFIKPCVVGCEIPVNVQAMQSVGSIAATAIAGAVSTGLTGGVALSGITSDMTAGVLLGNLSSSSGGMGNIQQPQMQRSGSMGSMTGILSPLTPYFIIKRSTSVSANNNAVGKPSGETMRLGDLSGYVEIFSITSQTGFPRYNDEIIQLLKDGVYL